MYQRHIISTLFTETASNNRQALSINSVHVVPVADCTFVSNEATYRLHRETLLTDDWCAVAMDTSVRVVEVCWLGGWAGVLFQCRIDVFNLP